MDLEAVQLLNLSPIPELSELELNTMLEQLSGLSDLNGDLTDRSVQDILKEAENLIDISINSKINELPMTDTVLEHEKQIQYPSITSQTINEAQESLLYAKNSKSSPVENVTQKSPTTTEEIKRHNSPVEQSNKIFSPGGSVNPIKSTINTLKEFYVHAEKQLSYRPTSPKQNQNCDKKEKLLNESIESITSPKSILKNGKQKTTFIVEKNLEPVRLNKGGRSLNCFERLYQERPNRLPRKQKVTDKIPKTLVMKKHVRDFKSQVKKPGKTTWNKNKSQELKSKMNKSIDNESALPKHYLEVEKWLENTSSKCSIQSNCMFDVPSKRVEDESENELVLHKRRSSTGDLRVDACSHTSSQFNEKLILKLLQGVEEIKDHVKKAGVVKNEVPEKIIQESQAMIDNLRSEVESVREKVASEKNAGIQRLEEQFAVLKDKYDQHMKNLEAENLKLRESLSEKYNSKTITSTETKIGFPIELNKLVIPNIQSADRKIFRSFSLENCRAPGNSPSSSLEDIRMCARKEAFSQTEKEVRSTSIQCFEEPKFEEVTIEEEDTRKTENKENVTRKKVGKERPFSERNVHQLLKQKKIVSGHESQLLATLRGLQTEITMKEKENRKLKTEIDLLKSQVRKSGKKVENLKRRHIGTQTIGLGPVVQKPYHPEVYEGSNGFEKENEELKSKIKALEEDFELLKEKRVNDLQALHQVHEEEMTKLLSKLETQSALTKHLHSLLLNR